MLEPPALFPRGPFPRSPCLAVLSACLLAACAQTPASLAPASLPQPARPPETRPAPEPASLLGVSPAEVERYLGAPAFEGRDGAARLWRYSAPECTLLIVFYEDGTGGDRSAHLEARRPEGGAAETRACLGALVNAPRA